MGNLLLKVFVGALAGLACWMLFEPMAPKVMTETSWNQWERMFTLGLGAIVGLAIGGINGVLQGGKVHTLRGFLLGGLFGAIGSSLGYGLGGTLANASHLPAMTIPWRIVALTPIGTFLGAGIGASSLNGRRALQGLIGGTIGAAIGAGLFDVLGTILGSFTLALKGIQAGTTGEVGTVPRAIFSVLMAACIALFIGIIERVARSAWVRLRLGRNEGKEWVLDSAQNFIGRSERANIPLFDDPNIAPMHACIIRQGPNQFMLADGGSPMGTLLNGQRVDQAPLFHGAMITVGAYNLEFLLKNQPAPYRGPEAYPGQAYPLGGAPQPGYPPQGHAQPQPGYGQPQPGYGQPQPGYGQPQPVYGQPVQPTQAYPQPPATSHPTTAYSAAQGFFIIAMDGPLAGQRFPIVGPTEVGREATGIPIGFDTMASRRHASLTPDTLGLTVNDLGSTNGTFVNGQRVQTQTLRAGDLVKIGATTFRVEV